MQEILLAAALSKQTSLYGIKLFDLAAQYDGLVPLYKRYNKKATLPDALQALLHKAWTKESLQQLDTDLRTHEIRALTSEDPEYPTLLNELPDKPYVLYVRGAGDLSVLNRCVSCVGTRMMTAYGKRAIHHLIPALRQYEVGVVSGMALGIDGEVHRVSLGNGIPTVAVLAAGLDKFEPVSHHALALEIMKHGCLLSEYPPGVRPQKHHFLERNRIIAGLAQATIVIEGKHHSGALVTARYALAYGREVGAVPGDIFLSSSEGPLRLIRDGGWPITQSSDILAMLGMSTLDSKEDKEEGTPLYLLIKDTPASLDELVAKLPLSLPEIQAELTLLEIQGRIALSETGHYYPCG